MLLFCQFGSVSAQVDSGYGKVIPPTCPEFIELTVIGTFVPSTTARFTELFASGPLMPGPLQKNPKTSLNWEQTHSGYSSEANTYRNFTESPFGTKSNSRIEASLVMAKGEPTIPPSSTVRASSPYVHI